MKTMYWSPRHMRRHWGRHWRPHFEGVYVPLNVSSGDEAYTVYALVPGIQADDLNIEVLDDAISIEGEFTRLEDESARLTLEEQPTGPFSRTIHLRHRVDPTKAEAEVKDGVLTLRVPKLEEARTRRINVKPK